MRPPSIRQDVSNHVHDTEYSLSHDQRRLIMIRSNQSVHAMQHFVSIQIPRADIHHDILWLNHIQYTAQHLSGEWNGNEIGRGLWRMYIHRYISFNLYHSRANPWATASWAKEISTSLLSPVAKQCPHSSSFSCLASVLLLLTPHSTPPTVFSTLQFSSSVLLTPLIIALITLHSLRHLEYHEMYENNNKNNNKTLSRHNNKRGEP